MTGERAGQLTMWPLLRRDVKDLGQQSSKQQAVGRGDEGVKQATPGVDCDAPGPQGIQIVKSDRWRPEDVGVQVLEVWVLGCFV